MKHAKHAAKSPLASTRKVALMVVAALALVLALIPALSFAIYDPEQSDSKTKSVSADVALVPSVDGSAEKQEVIYAALSATGKAESINVVNVFEGVHDETVKDYGQYSAAVNLTDESAMQHSADSVVFESAENVFSYQGDMAEATLPWNIEIIYTLDGNRIEPADLAGKSGKLAIEIKTSQNTAVNSIYFENYMLQATVNLPVDKAENVQTDDGSIALAGSNTSVSLVGMPGKAMNARVTADVENFEMDSISIAAVPFSMAIEMPDSKSLTEGFNDLIAGTEELAAGTKDLAAGTSEMVAGVNELNAGASALAAQSESILAGVNGYVSAANSAVEAVTVLKNLSDMADVLANVDVSNWSPEEQEAFVTMMSLLRNNEKLEQAFNSLPALQKLNTNSAMFLDSMTAYTGGVRGLAAGTGELVAGTNDLNEGAAALAEGTSTLYKETQGIPDAIQEEIDAMMADYDKSDFKPRSFVSAKNTNVSLVQFVMTTESIKAPEVEPEPVEEEELTILDRFWALFS